MAKKKSASAEPAEAAAEVTTTEAAATQPVEGAATTPPADVTTEATSAPAEGTATPPVVQEPTDSERLCKAEERLSLIGEARAALRECQLDVADKEQRKKEADADLKAAVGRRDAAVIELERVIDDDRVGQQRLPFGAGVESKPVVKDPGEAAPITVLNTASILQLVGQDEWEAAKNREEPIGMTPSHMDKLEAAEIKTIGALENLMREDRYWGKTVKLGEKGEARLVETLRVWRSRNPHPQPDEPTKTVVERLAEKNAAAAAEAADANPDGGIKPLPGLEEAVGDAPAAEAAQAEQAA